MRKLDYKELSNPLILFPLIILVAFFMDIRGGELITYSFIIFFFLSLISYIILVTAKIIKKRLYLFFYWASLIHLAILIPMFKLVGIDGPVSTSFAVLGATDLVVQLYYNIFQRKDGREIVDMWKSKLIRSERSWFHAISPQKYAFKDFSVMITDSESINPTNLHVMHLRPLTFEKIPSHIYKHQYGGRSYLFLLYVDVPKHADEDVYCGNETVAGLRTNKALLKQLTSIDKEVSKNIITAYRQGSNISKTSSKRQFVRNDSAVRRGDHNIKISIKKSYVKENADKVYSFLKRCNSHFNMDAA